MKIIDGNKACSSVAYLFSEVCAIYPITPSSPMAENIDYLSSTELNNLYNMKPKVIEMESEMGAAGALHGALLSGSLASTFTASQGLLLMIPNMYKIAGEHLPGVMHVAARSLSTHALSIFGDHQDIYAARQTGWAMLCSNNVDDAGYLAAVSHLSAIKSSIPFMHFFDGFRTSHELNTYKPISDEKLLELVDHNALDNFKNRALNINNDIVYGTSQTEDIYFQCMEAKNIDYDKLPDIVNDYMEKINKLTNKDYKPFNYYGSANAKNVIVAMGSICDTIRLVIDNEIKNGNEVGLIEVHLYRPFSKKYLLNVLPKTTQRIAVLDRTKEHGSTGEPLYLDIVSSLKDTNIETVGGRYGLSSKNTSPSDIKAVFNMLESKLINSFTISINDDLTNLSLPSFDYKLATSYKEFKIYGLGSDGMVSASKDILELVHNNNKMYVQGYFEYDSKKSGGVTISHLRLSESKINAPFYPVNPEMIVITKDEYFHRFDMLSDMKDGGFVLINTIKNQEEFNEFLPSKVKDIIIKKKLKINIINAEKIAYVNNLKGKINKIMEVNILNLLGINNAKELVIESIEKVFRTKGEDVINNNINAVNESLNSIKEVTITQSDKTFDDKKLNIYEKMNHRLGNNLSTKDVLELSNGALLCGLSKTEKRNISNITAKWNSEKCIECGMCALACPHAVIRPFISEDKKIGKPLLSNAEYNYYIGISNEDCTGCGLCASVCPTSSISLEENVKPTSDMFDKENPTIFPKFNIKGASLCKPQFEFSGACAGCGETPYLTLLSRLFGKEIVIANATGCSSIYGASSPSTPYLLPWANSLFEDNAEFAMGINLAYKQKREQILNIINSASGALKPESEELLNKYKENIDDYEITNEVSKKIEYLTDIPKELKDLKNYMSKRTVWAVGGDGWAYDIGYNGIDHLLHSNENIKILVLDTEVYSNTGGQASKSTKLGAVAEFADFGKKTNKKDLFKIASGIDNVYVASISFGANMMHSITAFKEAMEHNGPAIIIAYCPCIEHGIKTGMSCSLNEAKLAVECGYVLLMRSKNGEVSLDSNEPNFDKYEEFLNGEVRYNALKIKDENLAKTLLERQKQNAIKRFNYYKTISKKTQ